MQIIVKLFALMREKAGTDTVLLDLPQGASLSYGITALLQRYPALQPYMGRVRYARHMDFVDPDIGLVEGDEIALIPPVSGG